MKSLKALLLLALVGAWAWFAFAPKDPGPAGPVGPPRMDHESLDPVSLEGRVLSAGDAYGLPQDLALVGRHLVVLDGMGDPAFHVLRATDGGRISSFGREGEGPGEFRGAWSLHPVPGKERFWAFDIALQRLTEVKLREGRPAEELSRSRIVELHAPSIVYDAAWTGPERLLAAGHFVDGRLATFDGAGRFLEAVGRLPAPPPGGEDVPIAVLQQAFQGRLATAGDRSWAALGNRHAGRVEIFDAGGSLAGLARVPFSFPPRFSVVDSEHGPRMASGDDLRFGYIDVTVAGQRVYALFSGRTVAGFEGEGAVFGRFLHVFDRSGALVQVYELDADAVAVAVDPEDGRLFTARHLPAPAILRYEF